MAHSETAATFSPAGVSILTISDTRTPETDRSGALIREKLESAGHQVVHYAIIPDEVPAIQDYLRKHIADPAVRVVIATGGTGFAARDVTPEAVAPLLDREITGFGELFRMLSYEEIGSSTIQSRAMGGIAGDTLIFCLPGSTGACRMGMEKIILEQIDNTHRPCNFREILG